jgi:hypothetical protein
LELEWFKKISGLKINFSKTQVIWIGSKKYSSDRLCENWNLSWGKTTFGSAIKRWLSTGRINDLTTVILPIGVKFFLFHCLKSPFICLKYFSPHGSGDSFSTIVNGRIFLCHQLI